MAWAHTTTTLTSYLLDDTAFTETWYRFKQFIEHIIMACPFPCDLLIISKLYFFTLHQLHGTMCRELLMYIFIQDLEQKQCGTEAS